MSGAPSTQILIACPVMDKAEAYAKFAQVEALDSGAKVLTLAGWWKGALVLAGRMAGNDNDAIDALAKKLNGTTQAAVVDFALATGQPLHTFRNEKTRVASVDEIRALASMAAPSIAPAPGVAAEAEMSPEAAVDFLLRILPGVQHFDAFNPGDPKDCHFVTFTAATRERGVAFIEKYLLTHNLYYQPNEVRADLGPRRAYKSDIARIRVLHLDADPDDEIASQPGGLQREQQRLLAESAQRQLDPKRRSTFAVSSGRGVQEIFALKDPLDAREHQERIEAANRGILHELGTDTGTHDITRLLRIPCGFNRPNAKKRAQGVTKPLQVTLLSESDHRCTLEESEAVYPPRAAEAKEGNAEAESAATRRVIAELKPDMPSIKSVVALTDLDEDLQATFNAALLEDKSLRTLWLDGLPNHKHDGSRFAMAFAKALKRAGRFTATEFGQLLHCTEHSSDPEKMNARYMARAWVRSYDPENAEEAFADETGDAGDNNAEASAPTTTTEWNEPGNLWEDDARPKLFPHDTVPPIIYQFSSDNARRLGTEIEAIAVPAIAGFASLVPCSNRIQMYQHSASWRQPCILWVAIEGRSGSAKSSAHACALIGPKYVQEKWTQEYAQAKAAYDAANPPEEKRGRKRKAAAAAEAVVVEATTPAANDQKSNEIRAVENADDIFTGAEPGTTKTEPKFRQKIVNNSTTEALVGIASNNPGGLLFVVDELQGLIGQIDVYHNKSGKDRALFLTSYDAAPYTVNRVGSGVTVAACLALSIVSTVQGDKLKKMSGDLAEDGMLQRFGLVSTGKRRPGEDFPDDEELNERVKRMSLRLVDVGPELTFKFAPEASAELRNMQTFIAEQNNRLDLPDALKDWLNKADNTFGRYCLAFHLIEWASGPEGVEPESLIPLATAIRARRYIQEVLFPHARYVHCTVMRTTSGDKHARWIAGYILAHDRTTIAGRDIDRDYSVLGGKDNKQALLSVMADLESQDWLRTAGPRAWTVNPAVHEIFAERASAEREKRKKTRAAIEKTAAERRALREVPR